MRQNPQQADSRVKRKIFSWKSFIVTYIVILLMVGIQVGLIISPPFTKLHPIIQVNIIMLYWFVVVTIFLAMTNWQIKKHYDIPLRKLSRATKQVAEGDFSIYVEPQHTGDNYDYIDVMITDFNLMVQELGSIETLKNDFVANVSHEIKTPLAVIKNHIYLLKNNTLPEQIRKEYMDTIIKETDNLSSLVSNILRLNKLENQEIMLEATPYNLSRQLTDCILSFESLLNEKELKLTVTIEEQTIIPFDEVLLEIVWNNLLSNALKYTDTQGEITLTQITDDNNIIVTISDTGCGMDEDTLQHIFEKFYQGDTSHSKSGNGLGLALAMKIIDKLGGTLSVISEVDKGSTFTTVLPLQK